MWYRGPTRSLRANAPYARASLFFFPALRERLREFDVVSCGLALPHRGRRARLEQNVWNVHLRPFTVKCPWANDLGAPAPATWRSQAGT